MILSPQDDILKLQSVKSQLQRSKDKTRGGISTLIPCKFRDILAIWAIIDADQRWTMLNKRIRDPPFPQGIDNSRYLFPFVPNRPRLFFAPRIRTETSDRSPYRARYHFTHRMLLLTGPKIAIRAIINAANLQDSECNLGLWNRAAGSFNWPLFNWPRWFSTPLLSFYRKNNCELNFIVRRLINQRC